MPDLTTGTVTFTYECPYRNICTDNGNKCNSCVHSPNRSYYEPVTPYIPYNPFIPYWQPLVTYTCSSYCVGKNAETA